MERTNFAKFKISVTGFRLGIVRLRVKSSNHHATELHREAGDGVLLTLVGSRIVEEVENWHEDVQHITALEHVEHELLQTNTHCCHGITKNTRENRDEDVKKN